MSGQSIALATKGVICKGGGDITRITKCVIPLNLQLETNLFKLNLKKADSLELNLAVPETKINLKNSEQHQINLKITDKFKINLKKCEE